MIIMVVNETELAHMRTHPVQINDPRCKWGNLRHKLEDMLFIAL